MFVFGFVYFAVFSSSPRETTTSCVPTNIVINAHGIAQDSHTFESNFTSSFLSVCIRVCLLKPEKKPKTKIKRNAIQCALPDNHNTHCFFYYFGFNIQRIVAEARWQCAPTIIQQLHQSIKSALIWIVISDWPIIACACACASFSGTWELNRIFGNNSITQSTPLNHTENKTKNNWKKKKTDILNKLYRFEVRFKGRIDTNHQWKCVN